MRTIQKKRDNQTIHYMKYSSKSPRHKQKLPSYAAEFGFVSVSLLLLKLSSPEAYLAVSYFTICLPVMLYLVITLFGNLLKFIQMMHIEEASEETSLFGLLSRKQGALLLKVAMNLMAYFGIYFLTGQLDAFVVASDSLDQI